MKTKNSNFRINALEYRESQWIYIILITLLVSVSHSALSQKMLFPGNGNDDMYIQCYSFDRKLICRITDYGQNIEIMGREELYDYSEPIEGVLLAHFYQFYKSTDFGRSLSPISPSRSFIYKVFGGAIPGECLMMALFDSLPNHRFQYYKSYDNGNTLLLTKDSATYTMEGEMGQVSGEFYTVCETNGIYRLCHSLDFAATFDTVPISVSICKPNSNEIFGELHRGTNLGELFMVTHNKSCPTTYQFYHSADYGHSWVYKSSTTIDCGELKQFSAGRDECSFYYVHYNTLPGEYTTLNVCCSLDCGQTFTQYNHILIHSLSVNNSVKNSDLLLISPNPAKDNFNLSIKIQEAGNYAFDIYSIDGKYIDSFSQQYFVPGEVQLSYSTNKFIQGAYKVILKKDKQIISCSTIVIHK